MAWTEPRIWIDGPHLTAAQMNEVSDNLNETAPAKAEAAGDIFYATGANAIERLPIGANGTFLVPGASAPQWSVVPSPITTQGDLVVGNASGAPTRLAAPTGVNILTDQNGVLSWQPEHFLDEWWTHDQWWHTDASADRSEGTDGDIWATFLTVRDWTLNGGEVTFFASPALIRARTVTLTADTTLRCLSPVTTLFAQSLNNTLLPTAGGDYDTAGVTGPEDGARGSKFCGGGGAGTYGQTVGEIAPSQWHGSDGSGSLSRNDIANINKSSALFFGGGGAGFPGSVGTIFTGTGLGGGIIMLAARNLVTNGHTLTIDCSGNDGVWRTGTGGQGGGGGGCAIAIIQQGTTGITTDVSGGLGGTNLVTQGGTGYYVIAGTGGDGSSFLRTTIPN